MASVKAFIRVGTKATNKTALVRFRLSSGRSIQLFHKSQIEVYPKDWDDKTERIKAKISYDEGARVSFNERVTARKNLIATIFANTSERDDLTSEWLEMEIDKAMHPKKYAPKVQKPLTLFEWIEEFISSAPSRKDKSSGRLLARRTIVQYGGTFKHLKEFAKSRRKKDFEFEEIDQTFYNKWIDFMQSQNLKSNTIGREVARLKLFLNESPKELRQKADYGKYAVFSEEVDNVYLNREELAQIKDIDLSGNACLDRVRDWFLLLAWTGCRYSDLDKINHSSVKDGFITFRQQKTNTKVTIPLHSVVEGILAKYGDSMPKPISNQRFNEFLKEVVRLAGIDNVECVTSTVGGVKETRSAEKYRLVCSHTGRRSFATNMYLAGVPTLTIMSVTGHKTERSFYKYIKVTQEEQARLMKSKWEEIA
ncbi:MAG: site-specific integrase [Rikenellaceae bacterium]